MMKPIYPQAETIRIIGAKGLLVTRLTKEFIQKAYVDMGLNRQQLVKYCGVANEKLFSVSYVYHFTPEERRKIGGRKIALAQRTRNSNRHNTGKPRVVLDRTLLENALSKRMSLEAIGRLFKVAPQTVTANLEYLGLADKLVVKGLPYRRVIAANALDRLLGTELLKGLEVANIDIRLPQVKATLSYIVQAEQELTSLIEELRGMRRSLIMRLKERGVKTDLYKLPQTKINSTAKLILSELGYESISEFELGGKFFDFKVRGYKLLIEIDSLKFHNTPAQLENDRLKTIIAADSGYTLIRVGTNKDKKATLKKKITACLKRAGLSV